MTRTELVLAAAGIVLASGTAAFIGSRLTSSSLNQLKTHSLTIIDENNRDVAQLSVHLGSPEFTLFDQQHRKRAALFLESNGTPVF